MDGNLTSKNEPITSSLMDLLKKYTTRVDEHGASGKASTAQNDAHERSKTNEEKSNINYKAKWEESEAKYRALEKKYRELETGTIKQFQAKIDQLQRDSDQLKIIKDRLAEIGSCRQLTNIQYEQLKSLLNNHHIPIEPIANKNDFLQQTLKLRDVLTRHNDALLIKIDEMIKKKRKRNQYEEDLSEEDEEDEENDDEEDNQRNH